MNTFGKDFQERCMQFSLNIVGIYKFLTEEKKEYILPKQLLRSGTSIGANLSEAQNAISRRDYISKIYISLKECSETKYWIELMYRANYIELYEYEKSYNEASEIEKILTTIETSAIKNLSTQHK